VREHLETLLAEVQARTGAGLPAFVRDEFEAFLECGILAHGFLRVRCADCAHEKLVAFSCKRRGFCPSCGARRMAQSAAVLVDEVILQVPVRQWVLSFPIGRRILFAARPELLAPLQAASCTCRIALGLRAGQKVLSLRTAPGRDDKATAGLCAQAHGFSLHAGVRCGEHQRKALERLCRDRACT
jgi:hypothetical protein